MESVFVLQDVLVVNSSAEFMANNHVLATCRTALKKQGVVGLNMAPCMRAFLERLPIMLQEQYAYEKVHKTDNTLVNTIRVKMQKIGRLLRLLNFLVDLCVSASCGVWGAARPQSLHAVSGVSGGGSAAGRSTVSSSCPTSSGPLST